MLIKYNDKEINYSIYGEGKPIIFIHGFPLSKNIWNPQTEYLSGRGFKCITIDLPGFGDSESISNISSLDVYSDLIKELMEKLNIKEINIAGMSMGGYITLNFIERYPQAVKSIILIATKSDADDDSAKKRRNELININHYEGPSKVADEFIKILFEDETYKNNPDLVAKVKRETYKATGLGVESALIAIRDRKSQTQNLSSIISPVLIIHSSNDKAIPLQNALDMHKNIIHSKLLITNKGGHMVNMENPEEVNPAIENFLQKVK